MNKLPKIVTLGIFTSITVIFWIFFSILRVFSDEEQTVVPKEVLVKLDPNLDTDVLQGIESRYYSQEGVTPQLVTEAPKPTTSATPQPASPTPTTATSSATPLSSPTPEAETDL